jgi:hypothetical protein
MTIYELEAIEATCPICGDSTTEADICVVGCCKRCDLWMADAEAYEAMMDLHEMGLRAL